MPRLNTATRRRIIGLDQELTRRVARGDLGCGMRCNRSRKIQQRRTRDRGLHYLKKMSLWLKFIHEEIRFHPVCLAQQLLSALTNIRVRYDRGQPGVGRNPLSHSRIDFLGFRVPWCVGGTEQSISVRTRRPLSSDSAHVIRPLSQPRMADR